MLPPGSGPPRPAGASSGGVAQRAGARENVKAKSKKRKTRIAKKRWTTRARAARARAEQEGLATLETVVSHDS
jgi:hypothetical protein